MAMRALFASPPLASLRSLPETCSSRHKSGRGAFRTRASKDDTSSGVDFSQSQEAFEVVQYGLGSGSVAMYPRDGVGVETGVDAGASDQITSTSISSRTTSPTTQYNDGPLDKLAIGLFNLKLLSALEDASDGYGKKLSVHEKSQLPNEGFDRLVALADKIGTSGRPPEKQKQVVLQTLLGLIPSPVRFLFKILIKPSNWVDRMNAKITVEAFAWLVGPCEVVPRESDNEPASVELKKCRYLEQSGCVGSCVNFCKRPTEAFFAEAFGVGAHLNPNHDDGSCLMTFGVAAPAEDLAFSEPCYVTCGRKGEGEGGGACPKLKDL